jgi:sialic acid synthase SpsE
MNTLIIAEAGVNHNGDLKTALSMIDVAKNSGADIIKFQTFIAKNLVTNNAPKANYQIASNSHETQIQTRCTGYFPQTAQCGNSHAKIAQAQHGSGASPSGAYCQSQPRAEF